MRSLGRCRGPATASCGRCDRKLAPVEGGQSGSGHMGEEQDRTYDRHWDGAVHCSTEGLGAGNKHWDSGSGWLAQLGQRETGAMPSRAGRGPELHRLF